MKKHFSILICALSVAAAVAAQGVPSDQVSIRFTASANGKTMVLNDSVYHTPGSEPYSISRLKYYLSNLRFISSREEKISEEIFLIDAARPNLINLPRPKATLAGLEFTLGVDSILNCSGAQSGSLDPLNDMFWTWNNGYIVFKFEGNSDSSKSDLNRLEFHIGGYKTPYNASRNIRLLFHKPLPDDALVTVNLDLDKLWQGVTTVRFSDTPVISFPGALAMKFANNFPNMFSVSQ